MNDEKELTQAQFERIEAYLQQNLTEEENLQFKKELASNEALQKEVEIQRNLMLAVEAGALKSKMDAIHRKLFRSRSITVWMAVAASIILLVAVGIWLINRPDPAERLYAESFTADPGLPVPMSATDDYLFYDAMVDYKSGKYSLAESKWSTLLIESPVNDTLLYYIGMCNVNDGNHDKAIPYLEKVIQLGSISFSGKSEWYLALCYLKLEDLEGLEKLAKESESDYSQKIRQLTKELE
jgi:tetratricopeptide (TPR) repeat protein